ncbi:unnamed protein product [Adineta steineri]|uniref:G-protein coupled receptors family 1 profile domain-containing protein n=2 Tax=Adineta steineri TaxID=433720 RepID=A0A820AT19_9BILA|nr:unnamed protein product [Adineta steineri]
MDTSNSIEDALNFASEQISIYFGLSILILGVIGGILNLIVFTTLKTFRETTCAFYLTVVSSVNIGQLIISLFIRILSDGFNTDIRKISWVCKIHIYMASVFALISMTVMCFATINQYISMTKYRRFSNLQLAHYGVVSTCFIWSIYTISFLIFWDSSSGVCTINNLSFSIYSSRFHFPILLGFLPISIMITFSILAFHSARTLISRQMNIVRLSRDRQLTAMTLVHVMFIIITTIPYVVFFVYLLNQHNTGPEQTARNNLIFTIVLLISYSTYSGSFYIYCCVSERFRRQLVYVLMKVCINRWQQWINNRNHNRIMPSMEMILDTHAIRPRGTFLESISIR